MSPLPGFNLLPSQFPVPRWPACLKPPTQDYCI